jgi:hypothetical protein
MSSLKQGNLFIELLIQLLVSSDELLVSSDELLVSSDELLVSSDELLDNSMHQDLMVILFTRFSFLLLRRKTLICLSLVTIVAKRREQTQIQPSSLSSQTPLSFEIRISQEIFS